MTIDRLMVVHPGADWSVADVFSGMVDGLVANGVTVLPFQFANRLRVINNALSLAWQERGATPEERGQKPSYADSCCWVSEQAVTWALRHLPQGSWVIVVTGMYFHPDAYAMLRKAGYKIGMLLTESPYEVDKEIQYAALADKVWTNERSSVDQLREGNPTTTYLQHAYNPFMHTRKNPYFLTEMAKLPRHDVAFVGTGFTDRIELLEQVDWTGIDLGIYGTPWEVAEGSPLSPHIHLGVMPNARASAMYQVTKINLNLFRWTKGFSGFGRLEDRPHSLNPRLYELAAMGCFTVSEYRPEVEEIFGQDIPMFGTSAELQAMLHRYLADDDARQALAARLPQHVTEHTWVHRAAQMLRELEAL